MPRMLLALQNETPEGTPGESQRRRRRIAPLVHACSARVRKRQPPEVEIHRQGNSRLRAGGAPRPEPNKENPARKTVAAEIWAIGRLRDSMAEAGPPLEARGSKLLARRL